MVRQDRQPVQGARRNWDAVMWAKAAHIASGLTQEEVAERIGIDPGHLSRIFNRRHRLTERIAIRMAEVYGEPAILRAWLEATEAYKWLMRTA